VTFPAHWESTVRELEQNRRLVHGSVQSADRRGPFRDLLLKLPRTRKASHLIINLRVEPLARERDWASTSLISDPIRVELIRDRFGLRAQPKTHGDIWMKYVNLSPRPIPQHEFHVRYPDVPYAMAHYFVLMHELGHAVNGWRESRADTYAFRHLMLPQDPKAKKMRDAVYGKMKHPGSFMKWPV
jgi:hypothetical protein